VPKITNRFELFNEDERLLLHRLLEQTLKDVLAANVAPKRYQEMLRSLVAEAADA
jgi:hypothetical protein